MADARLPRGLIDTSVVIDLPEIEPGQLPVEVAISAITFEPLPVDAGVAHAYGRVYAAVAASGRKAHGRRAVNLLIAATAVAAGLPLYTRNPDDFAGLSRLLTIVAV